MSDKPACLRTVEVERELETRQSLPLNAATLIPLAYGHPDHFQASQRCSPRRRLHEFEPVMLFGTVTVTDKNILNCDNARIGQAINIDWIIPIPL